MFPPKRQLMNNKSEYGLDVVMLFGILTFQAQPDFLSVIFNDVIWPINGHVQLFFARMNWKENNFGAPCKLMAFHH